MHDGFRRPIVKGTAQGGNVELGIVMSHVDLREANGDVDDFPRARAPVRGLEQPGKHDENANETASQRAMQEDGKAWLVYDGECPLCRDYARRLDVKRSVGKLILVDARQGGPAVEEIRGLPWDLNEGMALKTGGRHYLGGDALHVLALLSGGRGIFSTMNRLLFGSRTTARIAYPLLKLGRRALLRLKGVAPI